MGFVVLVRTHHTRALLLHVHMCLERSCARLVLAQQKPATTPLQTRRARQEADFFDFGIVLQKRAERWLREQRMRQCW